MSTTVADKLSLGDVLGTEKINVSMKELRNLRHFGASITDDPLLSGCGRKIRIGDARSDRGFLERTVHCRRKWLCPTCGYAAACDESSKLGQRLLGWTSQGHDAALLTLTQTHDVDAGLSDLWDRIEDGWIVAARGPAWRKDRIDYGVRGYVRIAEVVHHPTSGWNVHLHVLLMLDSRLEAARLDGLKAVLAGRFVHRLCGRGGHADMLGQNLKPFEAGTEKRLANYCLKGNKPYWSDNGSRSPMAILSDINTTGVGVSLWEEFTASVGGPRRRMQLVPSKSIDDLCGTKITLATIT